MRKFLVLIPSLLMALTGFCQINFNYLQTDSLRKELSRSIQDTSRVLLMSNLAEGYRWSNPDSAMYYGQKALTLAQRINFKRGEASALTSVSVVQRELGNLAKALDVATTALSITQQYQYKPEEISALIRIANVYSASKNYEKALTYLHEAENKSARIGNALYQNIAQWLMAAAFEQMNKLDSAGHYADKAFQNLQWDAGTDFAYNILGDIQLKLNKDSLALRNYQIGLAEAAKAKDYRTAANLNISLANYYKKHNLADSAIYYAKEALAVAQFLSYKNRIISSSNLLAQLYDSKDPAEALKYYKIMDAAKESLYGAEKMQALQSLMMDEQEKQKKAEAASLAYQNRVRQYALIIGLLFFLIVMLLLYRNNRRKQKANELLNEQKQEIDGQRKAAEVETALEKVRTIAMSMKKPSDMLEVCSTISKQLELLGVKEIRNVQTAIFYEHKGAYMNYEYYVKHDKTFITETTYTNHKIHQAFADQMLKGKGQVFITHIKGEEIKDWIAYQRTTNVFIDDFLETASSLNYYWYSLGPVALGISTYEPLSEEGKTLFNRFLKVFELAYRRYLDIEQAEAQAREARIEASLERVRSKTMSMHNSQDVSAATAVMFNELSTLGVEKMRCGIGILKHDSDHMEVWTAAATKEGHEIKGAGLVGINGHVLWQQMYTDWEAKKESFLYYLEGEDRRAYYKALANTSSYSAPYLNEEFGDHYCYVTYFEEGVIFTFNYGLYSDEQKQILKRFAAVFSLTYRRYKDLKKAEAQSREATIEAALERVRGKAMAMHNTNDLSLTASLVFTELRKLGINPIRSGVGLLTKESHKAQLYSATSSQDGDSLSLVGWVLLEGHPVLEKIYDTWLKNEDYYPELSGEQLKFYYELLLAGLSVKVPDWQDGQKQYGHFFSFSIGCLYAWSERPYDESEIKILKRFASIVDLTFRRYFELQKSELNTKEAVKQAALDRIRANVASMRTVKDLDRITPLIWNELITLGVPFIRCGVFIMDNNAEQIHTFLSTPDGKAIAAFHLPYNAPGNISQVLKHWQEKKVYADHWDEEAFRQFANSLVNQGALTAPEQYLSTLPAGGFYLHFVPFQQGMLYVGNTQQLSSEEIKLLESVADAFSTAYARYEDFNKLDAAKKQVDKTLVELRQAQTQLIQAEKMASLGELTAGIAHEIQNPLNFVNNFAEVNTELLDELKEETQKGNPDEANSIIDDLKDNNQKIIFHGKRADSIVKGMLQHSRTSTGKKELTDINALADEFLRLSYHGLRAKDKSFNAAMETNFDYNIDKIKIIPQDLGRVLLNLFNNAFYSVNEKKKALNGLYEPKVFVSTEKLGDKIQIVVKDNGSGIPKKILDKIYQPFFTTKPTGDGTGLGLSLSYDIITKAHGGELKVETKEGEFALFKIILPALD